MKKLMYLFLFGLLAFNLNLSAQIICNDFQGNFDGWTSNNGATHTMSAGNNFLRVDDLSGYSRTFKDFKAIQDLSCTQICFDYQVINDGDPDDINTIFPELILFQGTIPQSANGSDPLLNVKCPVNNGITEGAGWVNNCINIPSANSGVPAGWNFSGTAAQWAAFISNVDGAAFALDYPGSGNVTTEALGLDNFCIYPTDVATFDFHYENEEGQEKTVFCQDETVLLIPNAQFPNGYLDFWPEISRRATGTGQNFANFVQPGWQWGQQIPNPFNLTQFWANQGVVLQPGFDYRVKIALSDRDCNTWIDHVAIFSVEGCGTCADCEDFEIDVNVLYPGPDACSQEITGTGEEIPSCCVQLDFITNCEEASFWRAYVKWENGSAGWYYDESELLYEYFSNQEQTIWTLVQFTLPGGQVCGEIINNIGACDSQFGERTLSFDTADSFIALPNPATDILNFHIPPEAPTNGAIELFSVSGVKVLDLQTDSATKIETDISHLSTGIYFYRYTSDGYQSEVKKLMVR